MSDQAPKKPCLEAIFKPIPDYTGKIVLRNFKQSRLICCVFDCNERVDETTVLHLFPRKQSLRRLWKSKIKFRKPVKLWHRVCSQHFTDADYVKSTKSKRGRLKAHAVPSLNLPTKNVTAMSMSAQKRALRMLARTEKLANQNQPELAITEELAVTEELSDAAEELASNFDDVDTGYEDEPICIHLEIEGAEDELDKVPTNKKDASVQVDLMQFRVTIFSKIIKHNKALNEWTGIPTFDNLKIISSCVETIYNRIHYSLPQSASMHTLSISQKVALCFIKLKTNLSFECISSLFEINPSSCSRVFASVIPLIREALQCVVYFPTVQEIRSNLPSCLKKDVSIVRGVLNSIEINIQIPKCTNCCNSTDSGYNKSDTTKFVICITPGGLISYVSKGYSGNSTDKFICNSENIINRFDAGDAIIIDKGFRIEKEAKAKGIKIIRPTEADAITNTKVAVVRVHVERVIEKMNMFTIMSGLTLTKLDLNLLPYIDDIVYIIASIVNLSSPILKENKL